jgi:hypothetical protein
MSTWTADELHRIGDAEELHIAALRTDGTLRKPVIIWVVRVSDALYVRSGFGHAAAWYRAARLRREGRIDAAGIGKDVAFDDADPAVNDRIDAVYREKYRRHDAQYIDSIVTPEARSTTLKLVPKP